MCHWNSNRKTLLRAITFFGLLFQVTNGAQHFEKQPEYSEVNPGQETRLTCKIFSKKGQCSWQKDNKPVGIYLGKYEWAGNPDVGDCSIRVMNAALEYDDGEWECQVTASDFAAQDALTSRPVKLVVRVPPNTPLVEYNGTTISIGKNLTSQSGLRSSVRCISRYGNPPARLKWLVGDEEVVGVNQTNKTKEDNPKKWAAHSILEYTFHKGHNGKSLRCVAVHEAYATKSRDTQVILDIQYSPQVKLLGAPEGDLEENKSQVTLRCLADANPLAAIVWRKTGGSQIYSFQETVELKPLLRKHQGIYSCEAKNFLGSSMSSNVEIDVKFPPKITRVGPERAMMASLYNRTVLQCQAEGNPQPTYQWLQKMTTAEESIYIRGTEHMLVIQNVTYDFQGKYICKASNRIFGSDRVTQSEPVDLKVIGAPQVLRHSVERDVPVEKGSKAILSITFCSNPHHTKAIWGWGSLQLAAGFEMGRFSAAEVKPTDRDDCYEAKLSISNADNSDSRHYYLNVENNRGSDKYSINLQVRDPVSMATVVGTIIGCLILLVIVVSVILYAFKAEKWCFAQRGDFKPTDLESEKSDADGSLRDTHQNGKTGFVVIPQTELHFGHHQTRKSRTPDSGLPPDFHVMKRNEGNFRGRAYPMDHKKDINYSDLQLPKTSNNGSMKKSIKTLPPHHLVQQNPSPAPRLFNSTLANRDNEPNVSSFDQEARQKQRNSISSLTFNPMDTNFTQISY